MRKPSELELQIKEICERHKFRIGYRTVRAWLKRDYNMKVNRNTVQKIMQKYNWQCRVKPKRKGVFSVVSNLWVSSFSLPMFFLIIYLFVLASFSNTPHVFFQVAAFYQIWQACVFHDTLSQLPYLWYPIDISPLRSPTSLLNYTASLV